jgi:hypothetical protein
MPEEPRFTTFEVESAQASEFGRMPIPDSEASRNEGAEV